MRVVGLPGMLIVAVVFSASAAAHHSMAVFDMQKSITLTGTVVRYEWRNPHVYIHLRAEGDDGPEWLIENGSPTVLEQYGWNRSSLRPGDRVTVRANPARNAGRRFAALDSVQKLDGSSTFRRGGPPPSRPTPVAARSLTGNWLPAAPEFLRFVGPPRDWPLTGSARSALSNYVESMNGAQNCASMSAPFLMVFSDLRRIEVGEKTSVIKAALVDRVERKILMNASTPARVKPTTQGYSVGRWEDGVLVVTTTHFLPSATGIREGVPSGPDKRLVERFQLAPDGTRLTYSYHLEDPQYLSSPVTGTVDWIHRPDLPYTGYRCDRSIAGRFLEQ